MIDPETKQVLCSVLEMLKQQAILSGRVLGWVVALGDTLRQIPALEEKLKESPYFHQATKPPLRTIDEMIQNIEALTQKLKD